MPSLKPKLQVNVGGMFSGKSTELQRQGKRHLIAGHKVLFIKPEMDNRYSESEIMTHDGSKVEAISLKTSGSHAGWLALHEADVYLFDEIQFYDLSIVDDIKYLLSKGKTVYVSGLDMDFTGRAFNTTAQLMALADEVTKFKAVCSICGNDGYVTAKTSGSNVRVELGSQDKYKPVCRPCFNTLEEENR